MFHFEFNFEGVINMKIMKTKVHEKLWQKQA
jgi:hypothetical protein